MIVLGHVIRGLSASGQVDSSTAAYRHADTALYAIHLAAFVLLSGLFLRRGTAKAGTRRYLLDRAADFAYLYLLWTFIQGVTKILTASLVNTPLTAGGLIQSLWKPEGQLWFFPFLLITTVLVALVRPWRSTALMSIALCVTAVIALAGWGRPGAYIGQQGWPLVIFFVIGAVITHDGFKLWTARLPMLVIALLGTPVFAGLVLLRPSTPTSSAYPITPLSVAIGVAATCIGVATLLAWSHLLSLTPVANSIAFLGERSMEIFLAHIITAAGCRIVLTKLGVTDVGVLITVSLLIGVAAPLMLWWLTRKLPLRWLFARPRPARPAVSS